MKEEAIVDEAKVVKFGRKPAAGFDLMRELQIEGDLDAPEIEPGPRKKARRRRARAEPKRMLRIEEKWASIPLTWLAHPNPFSAPARLLIALVYRSWRGQKSVELDAAIAAEACISVRERSRYARQLERLDAIHLDRNGQHQLVATLLWKV